MFQLLLDSISSGLGIISDSRHPERSNQDLSSEPKAGDNVTVAEPDLTIQRSQWRVTDGGREVVGRWPLGDADILYPRLILFCFFFFLKY